jgi:hypothetical protein
MSKCSGTRCGRIAEPPFKTCSRCRGYIRKHHKQRLKRGLCRNCKEPRLPSRSVCKFHAIKHKSYMAQRYQKFRDEVFTHYGEVCSCCGERESAFLTIDHIDGGGTKHVKTLDKGFYHWLVANGFPSGFRTLCFNCNIGRYRNGGVCPHQHKVDAATSALA